MVKNSFFIFLFFISWNNVFAQKTSISLNDYAKNIFLIIKDNDLSEIKNYIYSPSDHQLINDLELREEIKQFSQTNINQVTLELQKKITEIREQGEVEGVDWNNSKFHKFWHEEISEGPEEPNFKRIKSSYLHFLSNGREYQIKIKRIDNLNGKWVCFYPQQIVDVKKASKEPYKPYGVKLSLETFTNPSQPNKFSEVYLKIENHTSDDFTYLKYRVQIHYFSGSSGGTILERTFELKKNIYSDDNYKVLISELSNYPTNLNIISTKILPFVEVLDIKPNPYYK